MSDTTATTIPNPSPDRERWLLLIHHVPPKPDYLRVKVRRRLERIGAVALKNSVYVLPWTEPAVEDFQWLLREIAADGGESSVCEAAFVEGVTDGEMIRAFQAARDADYAIIAKAAESIATSGNAPHADGERTGQSGTATVARLRRRFDEVSAIDFFSAPEHARALAAVAAAEARLRALAGGPGTGPVCYDSPSGRDLLRGRTWVTRRGVHVDRIASAWLILRFIDPAAKFTFVPAKGYRPKPRELRFDMYDAEYTHEGDRCTFETLLVRFGLHDGALQVIGEIVHDIDLKEARFGRPETAGLATVVEGIALTHADDATRLERGALMLDGLYSGVRHKVGGGRQVD